MPPAILVVMLDGIADRPWPVLGGRTPLGAAHTPNLDAFAASSATGILHSLGPGRAPGTELAHFVLLGYDEADYPGRGVMEALGAGVPVAADDVVLHALLVRVRRESDGTLTVLERQPGWPEIDPAEMVAAITPFRHGMLQLRLTHVSGPEAILTVSSGAAEHVTDTDPHNDGWRVGSVRPLEDAPEPGVAALTADALTAYLRHAYAALRSLVGATGDESPFLLLKWTSRPRHLTPLREHVGMRGVVVSSTRLLSGLSALLGTEHRLVPQLHDPAEDARARLDAGFAALADGAEFVLVHDKAPDTVGHAKDPELKRDVIAAVDAGLGALNAGGNGLDDAIVVVTGDHGTPAGTPLIHSGDPVPLAIRSSAVERDAVSAFGESACASGSLGQLRGADFMPVLLNLRGTVRYTGGRLTPHEGLHWPTEYEPFRVDGGR